MTADEVRAEGRQPGTERERVIAGVWAELLGIPDPPTDVNFFELGGYSLAVKRLAVLLKEAFGLPVPVADLFRHATIVDQAVLVERLRAEQPARLAE